MAQYALADHVFVCLNGEHLVLLDLKEDRYWALEAAQTAGLGALVPGWPIRAEDETASAGAASLCPYVSQLCRPPHSRQTFLGQDSAIAIPVQSQHAG